MKRQLLETLTKSKDYTIQVAQAMPGHLYHFKPVTDIWDFGELFGHTAYGVRWYLENYIRGMNRNGTRRQRQATKRKSFPDWLRLLNY